MTRIEKGAFVFVALGVLLAIIALATAAAHAKPNANPPSVAPGKTNCASVDCKRRRVWKKRALALSSADWAWLHSTGDCETGHIRRSASYRVHGEFFGRYQFALDTAWRAGFTMRPDFVWRYEQDVRAIRWRNAHGRGQWPICG